MKDFQTYLESANQLINLSFEGHLGSPLKYSETILRNAKDYEYSDSIISGEIQKGKRWLSATVSKSRIGVAESSVSQGVFSIAVWCYPENRDETRRMLVERCKKDIMAYIERIKISLDSVS